MIQFTIFAIIQLVLLPLTIIGYIFSVVKALLYSKKHGISGTATNPLSVRWILHIFGLREDEDGAKMISSLTFMSGVGLWLMMGPSYIAYRICGYIPGLARIPEPEKVSLRSIVNFKTPFLDQIMEKHIDSMDQVVFMGARFDTRAFKYCQATPHAIYNVPPKPTLISFKPFDRVLDGSFSCH